jgi:uncharacterized membrane protein
MTAPGQNSPPRVASGLLIASTLAWLWGILFALSTLAVAIPAIAHNGVFSRAALFVLFIASLAFALCYVGYGLRKARRSAGWVAIAVGTLLILLPLTYRAPITRVGIIVNLVIVGLTFANWRHLSGAGGSAGA